MTVDPAEGPAQGQPQQRGQDRLRRLPAQAQPMDHRKAFRGEHRMAICRHIAGLGRISSGQRWTDCRRGREPRRGFRSAATRSLWGEGSHRREFWSRRHPHPDRIGSDRCVPGQDMEHRRRGPVPGRSHGRNVGGHELRQAWPRGVLLPAILAVGCLAGAVWGAIPGLLKTSFGASEVIVTVMMNFIITQILAFLLGGPGVTRIPIYCRPRAAHLGPALGS